MPSFTQAKPLTRQRLNYLVSSGVFIATFLLCSFLLADISRAAGCSGQLFGSNSTVPSQAPAAVVFGDFNNDAKADMAVANFGFGTFSVSLGDGSGGFGTSRTFQSAFGATSIAVGDFNSDGKLDLAVADWFNHQVAISLGIGDGSFSAPARIDAGLGPQQIVVGDLNGDQKLDFATASFFDNAVSVFLGNGSGGFSQASGSPFAAGSAPRSLRLADFNSDNKLDVAVAGASGVTVLLGNGLGGLAAFGGSITAGQAPYYVDAGDFNGDSKLDLAVSNNSSHDVSIFMGDGAGHFQLVDSIRVGTAPRDILVADLDGNGKPDIVSANFDSNTVTVLLNDGTGNLRTTKSFPVGNNPRALALTDLNGDGNRDLAVANYASYTVSLLMGLGGGDFSGPTIIPVFFNPALSLATGDYNGDGRVDLAAGNSGRTSILLSDGAGGFSRVADVGFGAAAFVSSLDLNGDGKLDLVTSDGAGGNILSSMLGIGDGTFGPRKVSPVGTSPMSIAAGDFNLDGTPDVATSNYGSSGLSILLGDGFGGFGPATAISLAAQTPFVASGDFNNDGKTDLVAARYFGDSVAVLLGNGNGTFGFATGSPFSAGLSPQAIAVSDFNGDGDADLAITNQPPSGGSAVSILLGNGNGSFSAPTNYTVGAKPSSIAVGDYNADGKPDLATANKDSNNLSVLVGNGNGTFGPATNFDVGLSPVFVATADFNSDGKKDLAAAIANGVAIIPNKCSAPPVAPPSLTIGDNSILEGNTGTVSAVFTVTLSAPADVTVSVGYNTLGLTATSNIDFQLTSGRLKFAPGVTTQTIAVPIVGDDLDEFDEIVGVNLKEELNATVSRPQAKVTILDNDPPPTVSIDDVSIQEGDAGTKTANLTVSLSKLSGKPISVQFATNDGSAVASGDYIGKSGTVSIPAGTLTANISVQIVGETTFETDESFFVTLSDPTNVVIDKGQAQVSILNNDPIPSISIDDVSVIEGQAGTRAADFRVRLSNASYQTISANFGYADGTASAGSDYVLPFGTVSFGPGETEKVVTVQINGDTIVESNETFLINLSSAVNSSLSDAQGVGTILNDDTLQLILDESGPGANQAAALESMLFVRDPFRVRSIAEWLNGPDQNTRVIFFANLQLDQGQPAAAVVVSLVDINNQSYDVPAEDVRPVSNSVFAQVTVRLPDNLSAGVCTVTIKAHGQISNTGTVRIRQ